MKASEMTNEERAKEGDNETVEQLCEEIITQWATCYFSEGMKRRDGEYSKMIVIETAGLANRILAAHRSEMESKDAAIESLEAAYTGCRDELRATRERRDVCETKMRTALERVTRAESKCDALRKLVEGLLEASATECAECRYDCGPNRENCIIHEAAMYIGGMEATK